MSEIENRRLADEIKKLQEQLEHFQEQVETPVLGPVADLMSQSAHPLLNRSATPPTFERENFQVGTSVYVVFNQETRQYILLTASRSIFYFVHENCLEPLGLCPPADIVDKVNFESHKIEKLINFRISLYKVKSWKNRSIASRAEVITVTGSLLKQNFTV